MEAMDISMRKLVRVKICGITCPEDARAAADVGAHAIGINFHPPAKVYIAPYQAAAVAMAARENEENQLAVVAVFVNPERSVVEEAMDACAPDVLQFHGEESPKFCRQFDTPYIKVCRPRTKQEARLTGMQHTSAAAVLLDSYSRDARGGTGKVFDWRLIPREDFVPPDLMPHPSGDPPPRRKPEPRPHLILAGGLTPENVRDAVLQVRPWAVDVSSGVAHSGDIRRKDGSKMRDFVFAANPPMVMALKRA